jgi:hypothetical protein
LARLLIDHGADVSLGANLAAGEFSYATPIVIAHENEDDRMEELLRANGAFLNPLALGYRMAWRLFAAASSGGGH